jgi:hypothetical protein
MIPKRLYRQLLPSYQATRISEIREVKTTVKEVREKPSFRPGSSRQRKWAKATGETMTLLPEEEVEEVEVGTRAKTATKAVTPTRRETRALLGGVAAMLLEEGAGAEEAIRASTRTRMIIFTKKMIRAGADTNKSLRRSEGGGEEEERRQQGL